MDRWLFFFSFNYLSFDYIGQTNPQVSGSITCNKEIGKSRSVTHGHNHLPKCLWQSALSEAEELPAIPQACTQADSFPTTTRSDFLLSERRQSSEFHLWTFSSALLWRFTKKKKLNLYSFLQQTHPDRQLRRCPLTARLASRYIHNGSWGSHWWSHILESAFFPCLCLSPTILNDLLLNESALTALNTLPELRCQKLSIEIKTNLISLEIAAAVKEMSRF